MTANTYTITIPGQPVPKGRPRFGKGRTYTPAKTVEAEQAIAWEVKKVIKRPLEGDVAMDITFYVKGNRRGDIDNLQKLVLDACNKVAFLDDKQVVTLHSQVVTAYPDIEDPGTVITIWEAEWKN